MVKTTPHTKRGGRKGGTAGPSSDGVLRIATNLLDVPAEIIADIYRHRWTIELFFRFFKHVLGCRHLLSTHPKGIEIQAYCAIIACLLISLWTGRKPTLRTYEMICLYFTGLGEPRGAGGAPREIETRVRLSPRLDAEPAAFAAARLVPIGATSATIGSPRPEAPMSFRSPSSTGLAVGPARQSNRRAEHYWGQPLFERSQNVAGPLSIVILKP